MRSARRARAANADKTQTARDQPMFISPSRCWCTLLPHAITRPAQRPFSVCLSACAFSTPRWSTAYDPIASLVPTFLVSSSYHGWLILVLVTSTHILPLLPPLPSVGSYSSSTTLRSDPRFSHRLAELYRDSQRSSCGHGDKHSMRAGHGETLCESKQGRAEDTEVQHKPKAGFSQDMKSLASYRTMLQTTRGS